MLTVKTITYNSLTTVYDSILAKHSIDAIIIKNCTQYSHTEYSNFEPLVNLKVVPVAWALQQVHVQYVCTHIHLCQFPRHPCGMTPVSFFFCFGGGIAGALIHPLPSPQGNEKHKDAWLFFGVINFSHTHTQFSTHKHIYISLITFSKKQGRAHEVNNTVITIKEYIQWTDVHVQQTIQCKFMSLVQTNTHVQRAYSIATRYNYILRQVKTRYDYILQLAKTCARGKQSKDEQMQLHSTNN